MRQIGIWKLTYGRATQGTALIAADTFDAATKLAVWVIKDRKPEWRDVDTSDICGLARTDETVVVE